MSAHGQYRFRSFFGSMTLESGSDTDEIHSFRIVKNSIRDIESGGF